MKMFVNYIKVLYSLVNLKRTT